MHTDQAKMELGVQIRALVHTERPVGKNYARKIPKNALPLPDIAA